MHIAWAYVNEPLRLADNEKHAGKTEVLIYYTNETAPVGAELENYEIIISWLESSESPAAQKIVGQLRRDMSEYRRVADREIEEIRELFSRLEEHEKKRFIVFSNRLAREKKFLTLQPGESEFEEHEIVYPVGDNYIVSNNPLATEEGFFVALQSASDYFAPEDHVFLLLSKSHGNPQMAFTPRLIVRNELETRESILAKVEGDGESSDAEPATEDAAPRIGTTKEAYFQVLQRAGDELGMFFPLVFMEACQSGLGLPETQDLPSNIGLLFTTQEKGTQYWCIQWEAVILNDHSILESMDNFLWEFARNYDPTENNPAGGVDWRYLLFLPLMICLVVLLCKGVGWAMRKISSYHPK